MNIAREAKSTCTQEPQDAPLSEGATCFNFDREGIHTSSNVILSVQPGSGKSFFASALIASHLRGAGLEATISASEAQNSQL